MTIPHPLPLASRSVSVLSLHADLVRIPSLSFQEKPAADHVEAFLRGVDGLEVGRLDENVWASLGDGTDDVLLLCSHLPNVDAPRRPRPVVRVQRAHLHRRGEGRRGGEMRGEERAGENMR